MAFAFPIFADDQIVGSGFLAGIQENMLGIVTVLHVLGTGQQFKVGLPPHGGDVSRVQNYPLPFIPARDAPLVITEPLLDLAVLLVENTLTGAFVQKFIGKPEDVSVGTEVLVIGYPFGVLGSVLETVEPCTISALGNRMVGDSSGIRELILNHQTHPGSSGSPVVRRSDGVVCGVLRGCLAPPGQILIGNIPIGTDTSVSFATSAHLIPMLVAEAFKIGIPAHV